MAINTETSGAAEKLARTALEPYQAAINMTVAVQEQNMKLARGLIEQSRKQQEAFWKLSGESFRAYTSFFGVALPRSEARAGDGGSKPPVEDYDRLSVEEVSRKLTELDEVEELKEYEKNNKNRATLVERFDRSLV